MNGSTAGMWASVSDNCEDSTDLEPVAWEFRVEWCPNCDKGDKEVRQNKPGDEGSTLSEVETYDLEPLVRLSDIIEYIRIRRAVCADNGRQRAQYAMLTLANELEEFTQKTGEEAGT